MYGTLSRREADRLAAEALHEEKRQCRRWRYTHVALTYSQCNEDGSVRAIEAKLRERGADEWLLYEEEHKDGGTHYHAYVCRWTRFDFTNARYFDVQVGTHIEHPNIQGVRNVKAWKKYIGKDRKLVGCYPGSAGPDEAGTGPADDAITVAANGDLERARQIIRVDPRYLLHGGRMEANIRRLAGEPVAPARFGPEDFRACEELKRATEEKKTLVLSGPTGTGKTQWARANYPDAPIWSSFRGKNGSRVGEGAVIFDDVDHELRGLVRTELIHLFDSEELREVRCPYGCFQLGRDVKRIITTNAATLEVLLGITDDLDAIRRRIRWVNIRSDLRKIVDDDEEVSGTDEDEDSDDGIDFGSGGDDDVVRSKELTESQVETQDLEDYGWCPPNQEAANSHW